MRPWPRGSWARPAPRPTELKVKADQDIELAGQKATLELRDSVVSMAIGAAEKVIGERLDDQLHRKLIEEYISDIASPGESPHA